MNYMEALRIARVKSMGEHMNPCDTAKMLRAGKMPDPCTVYVTCRVRIIDGIPKIDPHGFGVSDFIDGSVIAILNNGDMSTPL